MYEYYDLLQNMQRRHSLGLTTKIPRPSTRKFKTRRSQSSFSSNSDIFADNESTKCQADLSVSEMKLDGNQERSAEAGTSIATKSEVPRPDRRARRLWTPSTKGNERSSDPTLSQANISNGRKSKGRGRPRSVPRSNREKKR